MDIKICDVCGLCAGCTYAINTALNAAKNNGNIVLFKEIVHNKNVNKMLENLGVKTVNTLDNLPNNSTVVLRAHGEPKSTYEFLEKNKINYVDCTCFNVKNIHEKVEEFSNKNYNIIIIGKHGKKQNIHPEVFGTIGWCNKAPILIEDLEDLQNFTPQKNEKYYIVCQTTFNIKKADILLKKIEEKCKEQKCELFVNKSLCMAQKLINQKSVELAKQVDLMIVVGGKNSSNTQELFKNVKQFCPVLFIEDISEIFKKFKENNIKLNKNFKIGLTAGASTLKQELETLKRMLLNSFV